MSTKLNGMNVLLANEYILQMDRENRVDVHFNGGYTLSFIFNKLDSTLDEKSYKNIEADANESIPNKHSVYRINYTEEDTEFGIVRAPTKLFMRKTKDKKNPDGDYELEQVRFNFTLEKKLGIALLFKLFIVSEHIDGPRG